MKQSLTKLVSVILQKLQERPDGLASEAGLRTWLLREGYAKNDIDVAMNMVRPRLEAGPHVMEGSPLVTRQLSDYESGKLSREARDALARLEMYDLLDPMERESVLDRIDQFEGEVGLADLDYLIAWLVFPHRDVEHQQAILRVLEGREQTLQ